MSAIRIRCWASTSSDGEPPELGRALARHHASHRRPPTSTACFSSISLRCTAWLRARCITSSFRRWCRRSSRTLRQVCENYFHIGAAVRRARHQDRHAGAGRQSDRARRGPAGQLPSPPSSATAARASWWTSARRPTFDVISARASTWAAPSRRASASAPMRSFPAPRA